MKIHVKHLKIHRNITNNFHCGYNRCNKIFELEVSFRSHVSRFHLHQRQETKINEISTAADSGGKFVCNVSICKMQFQYYSDFTKHLKSHMNANIKVQCPFPKCMKAYDNVSSFTGHLSRTHRNAEKDIVIVDESNAFNNVCDLHPNEDQGLILDEDPIFVSQISNQIVSNNDSPTMEQNLENLFIKNVTQFYMKLESQFLIPVSALQYIISEYCNIYKENQCFIKSRLRNKLIQQNIEESVIESVINEVFNFDLFTNTNKMLDSNYKRKQFYSESYDYIQPVQIKLPSEKFQEKYFHYVPPAETIRCLYQDKNLEDCLSHKKVNKETGLIKDCRDGTVYLNNKDLHENPDALEIVIFQDAFETVNPLGAAKVKHKLLGIYMSFWNIPEHLRSHVNTIKLVGLCREKNFNHEIVFGRIVSDLEKIRSEGVKINNDKTVKGILLFIIGNNLGSHSLGGFKENFSNSEYFCRYSLIQRSQFHEDNDCYEG